MAMRDQRGLSQTHRTYSLLHSLVACLVEGTTKVVVDRLFNVRQGVIGLTYVDVNLDSAVHVGEQSQYIVVLMC
jgi:hypothetical protein